MTTPDNGQGCLAIAAAAAIVALVIAVVMGALPFYLFVLPVTLAIAGLIGFPLFLWIRRSGRARWWTVCAAGFATGALVPALLVLPGPIAQDASTGGVETIVDGNYTAAGWLQNLGFVFSFGLLGVAGAGVAWAIMTWTVRRSDWRPKAVLAAGIVVAIAGAAAIPTLTMDRSCHNPFRDGGSSLLPSASFDLMVPISEWRAVAAEVERFGREQDWSIRTSTWPGEGYAYMDVSICREPEPQIDATGIAALEDDGAAGIIQTDGFVSISAYQRDGSEDWRAPFRALHDRLVRRWPDTVRYRDARGMELSGTPAWAKAPSPPAPSSAAR